MANEYRLDDQVGYRLRLATQRHLEIFSQHLSDVTPTQFSILARLYEVGETSQNQLGRLVAMDAATTKGVISRLLEKQLVEVRADPNDLRRRQISLTDAGREVTIASIEKARKITAETVAHLTERDVQRLLALLDKIYATRVLHIK
jgi:MarR family transcriptional regulator, lower aerobic nicotinate degradation pathway regulator